MTHALIITRPELLALIEQAVEKKVQEIAAKMASPSDLPIRLTCKQAAKDIGCSNTTFHAKYRKLKRFDGNSVYVLSSDLVGLK